MSPLSSRRGKPIGRRDMRLSFARARHCGCTFSHRQGGGDKEIERSFTLELVSLLTIPLRAGIERERLAATQLAVATEVLDVGAQARRAYYRTVAARQAVHYAEQVQVAAE